MTLINGKTKLTGIIGDPIDHTLSPVIQNAAFKDLGINWLYVPLLVKASQLEEAIAGIKALNFKGINVTMPHKETVIPYLDEVSSYASLAGAVNTINNENGKLIGYNSDGQGFLRSLEEASFSAENKKVFLFGSGGAARSLAVILALSGAASISVANRNKDKAEHLVSLLQSRFDNCTAEAIGLMEDYPSKIKESDLIINSTPVGWDTNESLLKSTDIRQGQLVADLVYVPEQTALLTEAKKAKAKILPGKQMLLYQGAASFEIWTTMHPSIKAMREALDKALTK
ncbi:MAG: shikimate dehydrogenase [Actinobacteria bacterium]|nr:MAG: shikimate dehydrogenase [Actinomycetota bacterium]